MLVNCHQEKITTATEPALPRETARIMAEDLYQQGQGELEKFTVPGYKEAIKYFVGEYDFTSFISAEEIKENKVRIIYEASIGEDNKKVYFTFIGNGFLKYQVRNMVGTLIEVGSGKRSPEDIKKIIEAKDRKKAGKTAKPEGLYLKNIWF